MKSLTDYIRECIGSGDFATPLNTIGMGDVQPLNTDPVPININISKKKRKHVKHKKRRYVSEMTC